MTCRGCSLIVPKVLDCNQTLEDGILRMSGTSFQPYIHWRDVGNGSMLLQGPMVIFIEAIARFLKAKPVVVNEVGLVYGSKSKEGIYDGVLGLIQSRKADIFAAPSIPSPERIIDFDYHAQIASQGIRLLTRKPETFIDPWGFVKAFEPAVWFYLGVTLLVFSTCTAILHWLHSKLLPNESDEPTRGVFGYIWFWFARLFPQPEVKPPHQWTRWCAISFMLPTSLLLVNALEADLKGSLVFKKEVDYVNSYEDLLRFKNVKLLAEKGNLLYTMFTRSQHPFMKKLAAKLEKREGFFSQSQGFQRILDEISAGKGVLVASDEMAMGPIVRMIGQTGTCPKIKVSDGAIAHMTGSLPMGNHLPYKVREIIQNVRLRISESFVFRQNVRWRLEPYFKCNAKVRQSDEPLEALAAEDLEGVGYLYSIGMAASIVGFLLEVAEARMSNYCRSRPRALRIFKA